MKFLACIILALAVAGSFAELESVEVQQIENQVEEVDESFLEVDEEEESLDSEEELEEEDSEEEVDEADEEAEEEEAEEEEEEASERFAEAQAIPTPAGFAPCKDACPAGPRGAVKGAGLGGVPAGNCQCFQVTGTVFGYRAFSSCVAAKTCTGKAGLVGNWWSHIDPATMGNAATYLAKVGVCPVWNNADKVYVCKLNVGAKVFIGSTESVTATGNDANGKPKNVAEWCNLPATPDLQMYVGTTYINNVGGYDPTIINAANCQEVSWGAKHTIAAK